MKPEKLLQLVEKWLPKSLKFSMKMYDFREPDWPNYLFWPTDFWRQLVTGEIEGSKILKKAYDSLKEHEKHNFLGEHINIGAFLGTWRYTKGIYSFEKEVYEELINLKNEGNIPSNVLTNLPEWCVYIETPGLIHQEKELAGFFAMIEWSDWTKPESLKELMFLFLPKDSSVMCDWQAIFLDDKSIDESVDNFSKYLIEAAKKDGIDKIVGDIELVTPGKEEAQTIKKCVSLLLYICSKEPEIEIKNKPQFFPSYPKYYQAKKGKLLIPITSSKKWIVGRKTGKKIREAREMIARGKRDGVMPHIRRSHWHGYWKGPRAQQREYIYKWLAPIFVNAEDEI